MERALSREKSLCEHLHDQLAVAGLDPAEQRRGAGPDRRGGRGGGYLRARPGRDGRTRWAAASTMVERSA